MRFGQYFCKMSRNLKDRPDPSGIPTLVHINYFILGLTDVLKGGENTFNVDFYFDTEWTDERLIGRKEQDLEWNKIWQPDVEITNAQSCDKDFENYILDSATGNITYQTRFKATCTSNHMNLQEFPFDIQVLDVNFETSSHTKDEVDLRMKRNTGSNVESKLTNEGGLAEWEFTSLREVEHDRMLEFDQSMYSTVEIQIVVQRLSGYYVKKIVVTILLIVAMSFSVFWMKPDDVGDRVGISATMSLTTIAFNFEIQGSLPRVNYLTHMDKFLTFCFGLVITTVLENVLVYEMDKKGYSDTAKVVDLYSFFGAVSFLAMATLWFLTRSSSWRDIADKNKDGVLDASEVLAFQERNFGKKKGMGLKRSQSWKKKV